MLRNFLNMLVRRKRSPARRTYSLFGLTWVMDAYGSYRGPCCGRCLREYTLRVAFTRPDGVHYYQLCCGHCQLEEEGAAYTLLRLLEMQKAVGSRLGRRCQTPLFRADRLHVTGAE